MRMWSGHALVIQTEQIDRGVTGTVSVRITGKVVGEWVKPLAGRVHSGVSDQSTGTLGFSASDGS